MALGEAANISEHLAPELGEEAAEDARKRRAQLVTIKKMLGDAGQEQRLAGADRSDRTGTIPSEPFHQPDRHRDQDKSPTQAIPTMSELTELLRDPRVRLADGQPHETGRRRGSTCATLK